MADIGGENNSYHIRDEPSARMMSMAFMAMVCFTRCTLLFFAMRTGLTSLIGWKNCRKLSTQREKRPYLNAGEDSITLRPNEFFSLLHFQFLMAHFLRYRRPICFRFGADPKGSPSEPRRRFSHTRRSGEFD